MVRFRKLVKAMLVVINACANMCISAGLALSRLAKRIEKRSAPK